ncbi:DMSO reductase anchor subunit [Desulfitobacterium dehalogenans ATCC 51507]|uniref:DMSO reductase anchor subunit n=1 Tax=Desulfitobacterium dehalogenans (strain ATCC 51507 / DSM 9161 / JW/IU-DC1) TaxID=756499 RepID=I4A488_DESDJ|nr:DmsC/YnfH family molybdoenzyme membrane anchor subunit [Desulfitobacterium dehalogenans]AFL98772.1 DMSO reductase anchor subunit [Desulfitobacterium dehalogenans ATCC 51507]
MHSWPLYLFTLAIQSAVGGCIMLMLYNSLLKDIAAKDTMQKTNLKSLTVLTILSILGLGLSFFDIGYPLNAVNAITNLGSSWLSREILLTVLFIALVCLSFLVSWKKQHLSQALLTTAGIAGLALIFAMSSLYSHTIFEPWNSINTMIGFYGSAIILGAVVVNIVFFPVFKSTPGSFDAVKLPTLLAILAAFIIQFIFMASLGSNLAPLNPSLSLVRWFCSAFAALLLVYLYFKAPKKSELLYISFGLLFVGELIGRYLFYLPLS